MHTFWSKSFFALLAGACVPLALAPFHLWPLMLIGIAGFYWLTFTAQSAKQALWFGWVYGCSFFGIGVSWVYGSMQTVDTPVLMSLVLTGGFCLLLALLHLFQSWFFFRYLKHLRFALLVAAPLWWVINEWFREWFLTGMPWLYAGYAFTDLAAGQLAAVVGIYGLSFLVALLAALFLKCLLLYQQKDNRNVAIHAAAFVVLFLLVNIIGWQKPASSWTQPLRSISVVAVQSNIDQRTKWNYAQQRPTLEFFGKSFEGMSNPDLILWPEAAMTRLPEQIPYFLSQVDEIGKHRGQAIITGILTEENGQYFNSMLGYGTADGQYRKQHLVPFGEYMPMEKYLRGLIAFFDLPSSTMHPAIRPQMPISFTVKGEAFFAAGIICYEAAYPGIVKQLAKDANLLAVVSNDAWFGDSIGPHQHLQISQMRAIENGRAMVRATQNGVSALIDANGKIKKRSRQFVPAELSGELTLRAGHTPFQALPTYTIPIILLIILATLLIMDRLRKNISGL